MSFATYQMAGCDAENLRNLGNRRAEVMAPWQLKEKFAAHLDEAEHDTELFTAKMPSTGLSMKATNKSARHELSKYCTDVVPRNVNRDDFDVRAGSEARQLYVANNVEKTLRNIAQSYEKLNSSMNKQNSTLSDLRKQMHQHDAVLTDMHTGIIDHRDHLREMQTGLIDHRDHIRKVHTGLENRDSTINDMHLGLENHRDHIRDLRSGISHRDEVLQQMHTGILDHRNHLRAKKHGTKIDQTSADESLNLLPLKSTQADNTFMSAANPKKKKNKKTKKMQCKANMDISTEDLRRALQKSII